jgi:hypothetical protein
MIHCVYGIYHLCRPAGRRTPGSSGAYHLFSAFSDLCVLPLYTYGAMNMRYGKDSWGTLVSDASLLHAYFIPALYYGLIGAGGLHLFTLAVACWLSYQFRQITLMPPDMNPLEDNLTSRAKQHTRSKSSVATKSTWSDGEKRLSALEDHRRSGAPYENVSRPPSIPFAHTRAGSEVSARTRDSRLDLPSRQYQFGDSPRNSPRSSVVDFSAQAMKRMSAPPPPRHAPPQSRGSYMEIPLDDAPGASTGTLAVSHVTTIQPPSPNAGTRPRSAKFTEAWYTSDSLVNRTQQRNQAVNSLLLNATGARRNYDAVQPADMDNYDSDSDPEPYTGDENYDTADLGISGTPLHPNPLRSNPSAPPTPPAKATPPRRPKTPYRRPGTPGGALGERDPNYRSVSASSDLGDAKNLFHQPPPPEVSDVSDDESNENDKSHETTPPPPRRAATRLVRDLSKRMTWSGPKAAAANTMRVSSIQPEGDFYSKPYGELKAATPPIMQVVGSSPRQVSSGNDFYDDAAGKEGFGRRNVSGKVAEEGRVNVRELVSRYAVLNG